MIRNCLSHNFKFEFREYDKRILPVSWKSQTIDVYNQLTIIEPWSSKKEAVVLDLGADGTVDKIEEGKGILEKYQKIYSLVLQHGLNEKRVIKSEGIYQVVM